MIASATQTRRRRSRARTAAFEMSRGVYGKARIGADPSGQRGTSIGKWIVGGLVVGGAVLWVRHQSKQIEQLYKTTGLPYQSFGADLRDQSKALTAAAGSKLTSLSRRLSTKKET